MAILCRNMLPFKDQAVQQMESMSQLPSLNICQLYVSVWTVNVQVNPYEMENVADTLNRALEMPLDERQLRMFQLKKREKKMDVDAWVQSFLHTMGVIYDGKVHQFTQIFLEIF